MMRALPLLSLLLFLETFIKAIHKLKLWAAMMEALSLACE